MYGTQQDAQQTPAVLLDAASQSVYGFAGVVELPSPQDWPALYWERPAACPQ